MSDNVNDFRQMLSFFQKKIAGYALTAISISILAAFVVLVFKVLGEFLDAFYYVLFPIVLAIILSYIAEPLLAILSEKLKLSKRAACGVCFGAISLVIISLLVFGVPYLASQISMMIEHFPEFSARADAYLSESAPRIRDFLAAKLSGMNDALTAATSAGPDFTDATAAGAASSQSAASGIPDSKTVGRIIHTAKIATDEVKVLFSIIASLAVVPVYLYYILISEFDFYSWLDSRISFFAPATRENIKFFIRRFSEIMQSFFRGQLLIASIMGLMLGIGLKLAGVNFGLILGLSAGLLNIIPYFGTIIGLGVILPTAALQDGGGLVLTAIAAAIFTIVQLIEGYYLTPKIMGGKTGLHPTVIIFSVFFWGTALNGILGMILAIPFSAFIVAAYPKFHEWFSNFLNKQ